MKLPNPWRTLNNNFPTSLDLSTEWISGGWVLESELGSSLGYIIFHEVALDKSPHLVSPLNFSLLICENRIVIPLLILERTYESQINKYESYNRHLYICKQ